MEIVYCGGCGRVLRRDDFDRGLARFLDNRPWCSECKPPDKEPVATPSKRQGSSAKLARVNVGTTRRETAPTGPSKGLLIGGALAVLVVLGLGFAMSGGTSTPPPVERPRVDPPRTGPDPVEAARALADLESVASLSPPDKILARCDEFRSKLIGTAQAKRFLEIEARAKTQLAELQVAKDLDAVKKLIGEDLRYAKADDVERRLKSLREIAGARGAEVDRLLADYRRDRQQSPHEKRSGPFFEDAEGFIRNWLVLGLFSNDKDKGLETDYLKTESGADPLGGQAVGKATWAPFASMESKVDFFSVPHLNIKRPKDNVIAYAACVIQVPEQLAAEFRMGSDDAGWLWVDGVLTGKAHKGRALKIDEDRYALSLSPGLHRVLLKIENHSKEFEFILRVVTPEGKPIPALKIWN